VVEMHGVGEGRTKEEEEKLHEIPNGMQGT